MIAPPVNSGGEVQGGPSAANHSAVLEHSFDLVAVVELPGMRLLSVSPAGRSLLQLAGAEPVSDLLWSEFVTPGTWQALRVHGLRSLSAGRPWRGTGFLRARHGAETPVRLGLCRGAEGEGTRSTAVITALDDTRVANMQTVLRNEQLLLHALLGTLPDSIYFKDRESRLIRGNAALAQRMGLSSADQLVGLTDATFFSEEHARQARADEERIIATGEPLIDAEEKETWPDGRITWVLSTKLPLRDWRGEIVGTFGISRDITASKLAEAERQRTEGQRFLTQKMESIGRLAAGVAHEINTPTQYIADNTHFLAGAFAQVTRVCEAYRGLHARSAAHPECAEARAAVVAAETEAELDYLLSEIPRTLEQTTDGISRVARIVRSLREFSHPNSPEKQPANLNHAIQTAVAVSRHEWKLVAEVVTEFDPELPMIPCVLDEFNQVILNLIVNAAHAIADVVNAQPGGRGRITLRTRLEGGWATIEVADTGAGIPEVARPHIFEPFFTTKPLGRGTGQGLALVHKVVVKNHQGAVEFTTATGCGTTFRLRLPVQPPAAPGSNTAAEAVPLQP